MSYFMDNEHWKRKYRTLAEVARAAVRCGGAAIAQGEWEYVAGRNVYVDRIIGYVEKNRSGKWVYVDEDTGSRYYVTKTGLKRY